MTDRARLCEILLQHLLDWIPGPKTATGSITARSALPGEIAAKKTQCPTCHGARSRRVRGIAQTCDTCEGKGTIKVDPQTGRRPLSMARPETFGGPERSEWQRQADADISRITNLLAQHEGTESSDPWTSAIHRQTDAEEKGQAYSFPALCRALERLRDGTHDQQLAYSLLVKLRVYAAFPEQEDHPVVQRALAVALEMLALEMPDRIVVPAGLKPQKQAEAAKQSLWHGKRPEHEKRRAGRQADILQRLPAEGSASVASSFALSRRRVQQLARETAA